MTTEHNFRDDRVQIDGRARSDQDSGRETQTVAQGRDAQALPAETAAGEESPLTATTDRIPLATDAGGPQCDDVLTVRLLPVLMHRMNNATQLISNLHAVGQYVDGTDWLRSHADDLSGCSKDIHEVGYLLAVIASANGANLLLERREHRGVHDMVSAVIDAVSRDGGVMHAPPRPLPDQIPGVGGGWELPWAVGTLLYASTLGQHSEDGTTTNFEWQLLQEKDAWVFVSSTVPKDHFAAQRGRIETLLPETQLDVCTEGWSWRLPAGWLRV